MNRLVAVLLAALVALAVPSFAADKDAKAAAKPATMAAQADDKIDINRAKPEQLMTLDGIGDARAKAIVKGRPVQSQGRARRQEHHPAGRLRQDQGQDHREAEVTHPVRWLDAW